ncbi:hypothetical protein ICN46_11865 [Polynucleobacter sp. Latsch14-2]|jgi:hypothetical protein|uniref:hypothetical protein n=1 Tax=Polynucleobacter sp. Latsch14-2 TaxID=2576920 RepID=UPI001C0C4B32|nr:hypothetical protein [Polynucleobacter sp. Latsch14-2]MBU3615587.1 hypothetical protein [Polynucleobacter sp. Latsch14-2]
MLPNKSMKDWATRGIQGYVMLMLEYLRLSPTYELARKARTGKLTAAQRKQLPPDFDLVLKTYDEYGDISTVKFSDWWATTGLALYGSEYIKPQVRQIANMERDEQYESGFSSSLERYFRTFREKEGNGPGLILAIPLGMTKRSILKQVTLMINKTGVTVPPKAQKARRSLTAKRLRSPPLMKGINLLWLKAQNPDWVLWRLGVLANISPTNAVGLDYRNAKSNAKTVDQRTNMTILTSRALTKAQYIAENAARGRFPDPKAITLPTFDYDEMYKRMRVSNPKLSKPAAKKS